MRNIKGISTYMIKIIAVLFMVIDHIGVAFSGTILHDSYLVFRYIGRVSFPLFAFLLVEGVKYTKNKWKYLRNMLIFTIISEIPFDLLFYGWQDRSKGINVFATLTIGLFGMIIVEYLIEKWKNKKVRYIIPIIAIIVFVPLCFIANHFNTDYAGMGPLLIFMLYVFQKWGKHIIKKGNQRTLNIFASVAIIGWMVLYDVLAGEISELYGILAIVPILFYNGTKGSYKISKWVFYIFYPAQMLFLYLFNYFVFLT